MASDWRPCHPETGNIGWDLPSLGSPGLHPDPSPIPRSHHHLGASLLDQTLLPSLSSPAHPFPSNFIRSDPAPPQLRTYHGSPVTPVPKKSGLCSSGSHSSLKYLDWVRYFLWAVTLFLPLNRELWRGRCRAVLSLMDPQHHPGWRRGSRKFVEQKNEIILGLNFGSIVLFFELWLLVPSRGHFNPRNI